MKNDIVAALQINAQASSPQSDIRYSYTENYPRLYIGGNSLEMRLFEPAYQKKTDFRQFMTF